MQGGGGGGGDNCVLCDIIVFFVLCREDADVCKMWCVCVCVCVCLWRGGGGDNCVLCDIIFFFVLCREDDAVCGRSAARSEEACPVQRVVPTILHHRHETDRDILS